MIRNHEYYEMQSALSATGHLTETESAELEVHVSQCASCLRCMIDIAALSRDLFLTQPQQIDIALPKGLQERFVERALSAGLPFKVEKAGTRADLRFAGIIAAAAALILVCFIWTIAPTPGAEQRPSELTSMADRTIQSTVQVPSPEFQTAAAQHTSIRSKTSSERRPAKVLLEHFAAVGSSDRSRLQITLKTYRFTSNNEPAKFPDSSRHWSQRVIQNYPLAAADSTGGPCFAGSYAPCFLGHNWDVKPAERLFHLDLAQMSLLQSDSPLNTAGAPTFKWTHAVTPNQP